jgi:hypothetical protein
MEAESKPELSTAPPVEADRVEEEAPAAPAEAGRGEEEVLAEVEVLDALPVISQGRAVTRAPAVLPAVQTAAAAATGFMVGAATLALLRRRDSRRLSRELRDLRRGLEPVRRPEPPIEPGQSYLVHVRVFSRPPLDPRGH